MNSRSPRNSALFVLFFYSVWAQVAVSFAPTSRIQRSRGCNASNGSVLVLYGSKQKGARKNSGKKANHEKWQPYFESLSAYKIEHGHCNVKEEEDESLYNWIVEQQQSYQNMQMGRKTKLTKKRAVALEQLGVVLSVDDEFQ